MPEKNMVHLVRAIVGAELSSTDSIRQEDVLPKGLVVTVSRDYGSGGLLVAKDLAKRLGVRCFDRELLDAVADDAKAPRYLMERLDEHVRNVLEDWGHALITGKPALRDDYRRHLTNVILGIAKSGGVIVGRGAHLIIPPERGFRVRITGSPESCAAVIAERLGIPKDKAAKECDRVNAARAEFVRKLFKAELNDLRRFDLVLNSDRFDHGAMVETILFAMRRAGLAVPD